MKAANRDNAFINSPFKNRHREAHAGKGQSLKVC
jgi:hypothetical protein